MNKRKYAKLTSCSNKDGDPTFEAVVFGTFEEMKDRKVVCLQVMATSATQKNDIIITKGTTYLINHLKQDTERFKTGDHVRVILMKADYYNSKLSLFTKVLLNKTPTPINEEFLYLPKKEDLTAKTLMLPVKDKNETFTADIVNFDSLVWEKDNKKDICVKNVTIDLSQKKKMEKILITTNFYKQHLLQFGITNIENWVKLGPRVLSTLAANIFCYIDLKKTKNMDYNQGYCNDDNYLYTLTVNTTSIKCDIEQIIKQIAVEVPYQFVLDKFNGEIFIDCPITHESIYSKNTNILNMNEFTGVIDDKRTYYVLLENENETKMLTNMKLEDRTTCTGMYNIYGFK